MTKELYSLILTLIPVLPLMGFAINITLGRNHIKDKAHFIGIPMVLAAWALALFAFWNVLHGNIFDGDIYTWISSGGFVVSVGFLVDQLTAVMLIVVTTVSLLVHIYSVGYMHGEEGYYRFFAYLNLFTFSMLMLIMGNNFLQLYFGWEAVGLCSYFLIGYYYEKKSASDAGKKAFIVNRFGDFGFGLGVILVFLTLGTLNYADAFGKADILLGQSITVLGNNMNMPTLIALLLFCGAVGKSAQVPLHIWLPDAMEGPTPVSALIHAATMVTAGVFMVARCAPIFNLSPTAMAVVAVTGAVTAIFAGTIALVQRDIKRIIAYSTVSQLGYMVLACGVGAYSAGIFHLFTHAFFKALLFLGAGSVMHAMGGELDIFKMGGLKKYMPITYWTFLLASLSIAGFPFMAGFLSKDEILLMAFLSESPVGKFVWTLGIITAFLTAFYSFRIVFLAFHGEFRGTEEQKHHLHESPMTMTFPLIILAAGAIGAGWFGLPWHNSFSHFMEPLLGEPEVHATHLLEGGLMTLAVAIFAGAVYLAHYFYMKRTDIPTRLAANYSIIHNLLWNKYYIDEIYNALIIRPTLWVAGSVIVGITDGRIIEGFVNGVPRGIGKTGEVVRKLQGGMTQSYGTYMGYAFLLMLAIAFVWY